MSTAVDGPKSVKCFEEMFVVSRIQSSAGVGTFSPQKRMTVVMNEG